MSRILTVLASISMFLWASEYNPTVSEKIHVSSIVIISLLCGLIMQKEMSK
ncbi:hypothetical protein [Bacillus haynesii]|uniref:hypothetical protein n=1 Tax=Bacillus haynesii TaxID=1925021 RepID=UPI001F61CCF0|nr:hypothetical protein [Bacillus haynesii]MCI4129437.1 hypothetical protein [Bacillus haynesii]